MKVLRPLPWGWSSELLVFLTRFFSSFKSFETPRSAPHLPSQSLSPDFTCASKKAQCFFCPRRLYIGDFGVWLLAPKLLSLDHVARSPLWRWVCVVVTTAQCQSWASNKCPLKEYIDKTMWLLRFQFQAVCSRAEASIPNQKPLILSELN